MRSKKVQDKFFHNTRLLVVANWNLRTLQVTGLGARRRTALIACELARYNTGIADHSETRLPDEGSLV